MEVSSPLELHTETVGRVRDGLEALWVWVTTPMGCWGRCCCCGCVTGLPAAGVAAVAATTEQGEESQDGNEDPGERGGEGREVGGGRDRRYCSTCRNVSTYMHKKFCAYIKELFLRGRLA